MKYLIIFIADIAYNVCISSVKKLMSGMIPEIEDKNTDKTFNFVYLDIDSQFYDPFSPQLLKLKSWAVRD